MERITITVDDDLLAAFDAYLVDRGYQNRSEAMRDLIREKLESERLRSGEAKACVGCLTYVYNHHERELARRLTQASHDHHDLAHSTLHVHLDHDNCLETIIVQGATEAVRAFADSVMTERGVRHGNLHLVPAEVQYDRHTHDHGSHAGPAHNHLHSHPKT